MGRRQFKQDESFEIRPRRPNTRGPASRGTKVAGMLATAALVVAAMIGVLASPASSQKYDDLDVTSTAHYDVKPQEGLAKVSLQVAVTNVKPSRTTARVITSYYFNSYHIMVPAEAENVVAYDSVGSLEVTRVDEADAEDFVKVSFRRNLFYKSTTKFTVEYDLPSGVPRSDSHTRINPSYVSLEVLDGAFGETGRVEVKLPLGFGTNEGIGARLHRKQDEDGVLFWAITETIDDSEWWSFISVANSDAYDKVDVEAGGVSVEIASWNGDREWARFVETRLDKGLPLIEEMVGLGWPDDIDLSIVESQTPFIHGYAGWFSLNDAVIEVGDNLDGQVLFHEVGHIWFNDRFSSERWINEGLTERFAGEVVERSGFEADVPARPGAGKVGAVELSSWDRTETDRAILDWAYPASAWVMWQITDEIGVDGLTEVVGDFSDGRIAYEGPISFGAARPYPDWQYFLDLVDQQSEAEFSELFGKYVAPRGMADVMGRRAELRERYQGIQQRADTWAMPFGVREAMAEWHFGEARRLMDRTEELLDAKEKVEDLVAPFDLKVNRAYERGFEQVQEFDDYDGLEEAAGHLVAAAEAVISSHDEVDAERSWIEDLGLWRADLDGELAGISAHFEHDELDELHTAVGELSDELSSAADYGRNRLVGGGSSLFVLGVGVAMLRVNRRRR